LGSECGSELIDSSINFSACLNSDSSSAREPSGISCSPETIAWSKFKRVKKIGSNDVPGASAGLAIRTPEGKMDWDHSDRFNHGNGRWVNDARTFD